MNPVASLEGLCVCNAVLGLFFSHYRSLHGMPVCANMCLSASMFPVPFLGGGEGGTHLFLLFVLFHSSLFLSCLIIPWMPEERQKGCVWIWMGGQVERNWKELWKRKLIRIYGILKSVFNKRKKVAILFLKVASILLLLYNYKNKIL